MSFKRIIAGAVTAGLLGITPVALAAAPAQATENLTTTTTLAANYKVVGYRKGISFSGAVQSSNGSTVLYGVASLQVATASNSTWTTIATDDSPSYLYFGEIQGRQNAQYRVVFSGYAAQSAYQDNYAASESAPVTVKVAVSASSEWLSPAGVSPKSIVRSVSTMPVTGEPVAFTVTVTGTLPSSAEGSTFTA